MLTYTQLFEFIESCEPPATEEPKGFMFVRYKTESVVWARLKKGDCMTYCAITGTVRFARIAPREKNKLWTKHGNAMFYTVGDIRVSRESAFLSPNMDVYVVSRIADLIASAAGLVACYREDRSNANCFIFTFSSFAKTKRETRPSDVLAQGYLREDARAKQEQMAIFDRMKMVGGILG